MIREHFLPGDVDILLVDDTPDNLRILSELLKEEGYRLRQVTSGERALEAVASNKPDLVLLDIHMPGMDGFAVCEMLKQNPETADVPIIFVTAQDTPKSKVHGFAVGGADYITKPFYAEEVLARVRHQLTIRHLTFVQRVRAERIERILSTLPVATLISRLDGSLIDYNPAFQTLLGSGEALGKSTLQYYVDVQDRQMLIERVAEEGLVTNFEAKLRSAQGREFWALISATTISIDGEMAFFGAVNDISERKQMEMQLELLATTDFLTGTLNRRSFTERAGEESERCSRMNVPLVFAVFDIDHFKKINDTWGHGVGDLALQHFVSIVQGSVRSYDVFGRLGGEEFGLLLPSTSLDDAVRLANRIRENLAATPLCSIAGKVHMYVSGGVALWSSGDVFDKVFHDADEALYTAKKSGRNRIVLAES